MASTYMGKPYYPEWLDNLAADVTGEGPAWDGTIQGAAAVHDVVVAVQHPALRRSAHADLSRRTGQRHSESARCAAVAQLSWNTPSLHLPRPGHQRPDHANDNDLCQHVE